MNGISELCKLLHNPLRLEILRRVYDAKDGVNVGYLADEFMDSGLGLSGVSQYLKQLERIGVVKRERAGRYVNYVADTSHATAAVAAAVRMIVDRLRRDDDRSWMTVFAALMNPFRAKVVSAVARAGAISAEEICERTNHQSRHLKRDLQEAIDAQLISPDGDDASSAIYHYLEPADELVRRLVSMV